MDRLESFEVKFKWDVENGLEKITFSSSLELELYVCGISTLTVI